MPICCVGAVSRQCGRRIRRRTASSARGNPLACLTIHEQFRDSSARVHHPNRNDLQKPARYAQFHEGPLAKAVAYTEASRGCKHLCRHCPVVPVYQGQFAW